MGAKENLQLIEQLQQAARDRDYDRYGEMLADNVVYRMNGVPANMGGVTTGRQAVLEQFAQMAPAGQFDVKQMFGDDQHVCVIGKVTADRFPGNQFLRGADKPYSTFECVVYRIEGGKVAESTAYVNWLDTYVQVGLIDPTTLIA